MTKTKFVQRDVESFTLGDSASIESLKPNQAGEVISPRSYLLIMHAFLAEKGGMAYQADLEAELTWHFSGVWGPDDLRPHKATGRPRWLNYLDWAKVEAGKGRTMNTEGKLSSPHSQPTRTEERQTLHHLGPGRAGSRSRNDGLAEGEARVESRLQEELWKMPTQEPTRSEVVSPLWKGIPGAGQSDAQAARITPRTSKEATDQSTCKREDVPVPFRPLYPPSRRHRHDEGTMFDQRTDINDTRPSSIRHLIGQPGVVDQITVAPRQRPAGQPPFRVVPPRRPPWMWQDRRLADHRRRDGDRLPRSSRPVRGNHRRPKCTAPSSRRAGRRLRPMKRTNSTRLCRRRSTWPSTSGGFSSTAGRRAAPRSPSRSRTSRCCSPAPTSSNCCNRSGTGCD